MSQVTSQGGGEIKTKVACYERKKEPKALPP